ncbi:cytochrome P450 1A1-like [Amphiura filiformis]|uniref:cytochrome P450 1A1-like n=1 Tax=Amphiura filiformis TaxID=82378 RepID=UPI003B21A117
MMQQEKGKPLPGPRGLPLLGNILDLGEAPHVDLAQLAQKYGNVYQIRIGSRPIVVLNGVDTIRQALVRQSIDFAGRPDFTSFETMKEILGGSMTFSNYSTGWKLHRKLAESTMRHFASGRQSSAIETKVSQEVQYLVDHWSNNNEGENVLDPTTTLRLSVSNIMCSFILGTRHELDDPKLLGFLEMSDDFNTAAGAGNPVDFMPWLRYLPSRTMQNLRRVLTNFKDWFGSSIEEHNQHYEDGSEKDMLDFIISASKRRDPEELERLNLTREILQCTVYDLFGAGFDTVSSTLHWMLLYLILHQDIQKQIQDEIDEIVGRERVPNLSDRGHLPFTEAFILEVLRHSSVLPFTIPHSTTRDTNLCDFFIPKDTVVFVNLYSANYDSTKWDKPEDFNPDRFLIADGSRIDPSKTESFLPFSAGRRRCLGSEIARMELFIYMTTLLHQCNFKAADGELPSTKAVHGLTTHPNAFTMKVIRRM